MDNHTGSEIVEWDDAFDFSSIVKHIEQIIRTEEWGKGFRLDDDEQAKLKGLLATNITVGDHSPNALYEMVTLGVTFVKETSPTYREAKQQHYRHLSHQKVTPLRDKKLTPADCPALKTWPEGRLPANGVSGRLENAGQFFQRLLAQGLYDEAVYGKLYLHELRQINPKLYLALAQWQNREKITLLAGKEAEIAALEQRAGSGDTTLSFADKARLSNARWRKKQRG